MLSIATDKTQTINRKGEVTSATGVCGILNPPETGTTAGLASTDLCAGAWEADFECSVVRPGTPLGEFDQERLGSDLFESWASLRSEYRKFEADESVSLPQTAALGSALLGFYSSSSLSNEKFDAVFTNGQTCMIVEGKHLAGRQWLLDRGSDPGINRLVVIVNNYASAPLAQTALIQKRKHLRNAYRLAMDGLRTAEAARARAVDEEAKLGIDWDDWEGSPD